MTSKMTSAEQTAALVEGAVRHLKNESLYHGLLTRDNCFVTMIDLLLRMLFGSPICELTALSEDIRK